MLQWLETQYPHDAPFQDAIARVRRAVFLHVIIVVVFRLCLAIAVKVAEEVLMDRGCQTQTGERRPCPQCGTLLESKGLVTRTIHTLVGLVTWTRRVLRCPHGCQIGQIAPFDEELGLQPYQKVSAELKQAACVLAVFVPFGIASVLLKTVLGVEVSPGAIWNWVQAAGKEAMSRLQVE